MFEFLVLNSQILIFLCKDTNFFCNFVFLMIKALKDENW